MTMRELLLAIVKYIDAPFAQDARIKLYTPILGAVGTECIIKEAVTIIDPSGLRMGDRVSINAHCFINAKGGVTIGDHVRIAHGTTIMSENHNFSDRDTPIHQQGTTAGPVVIGEDVWIGSRSVILPGVTVGKGSVIGAGSVVTKDVEPFSVMAGNPARMIKER
jgi:acetyltransferase-like isoleucine patch superfamily enzyme